MVCSVASQQEGPEYSPCVCVPSRYSAFFPPSKNIQSLIGQFDLPIGVHVRVNGCMRRENGWMDWFQTMQRVRGTVMTRCNFNSSFSPNTQKMIILNVSDKQIEKCSITNIIDGTGLLAIIVYWLLYKLLDNVPECITELRQTDWWELLCCVCVHCGGEPNASWSETLNGPGQTGILKILMLGTPRTGCLEMNKRVCLKYIYIKCIKQNIEYFFPPL